MKLSLCIVGCGAYARKVVGDIHDMTEELELFFASRDADKAREYCEEFGGAGFFGSYEEAAADPRVQALYFFTPHHLHLENALLAERHAKHILVEKPIARTLDESGEMIRAAQRARVKLMVAENYRYLPSVVQAKKLIAKGEIGDVRMIRIEAESFRESTGWRSSADYRGGGGFIDGGIHAVDMLLNLGGFPESAYAATPPKLFAGAEGEDDMVMVGRLPGSAVG